MDLRPETTEFLRELERFANRKLLFPKDVGQLLEAARQHGLMQAFEEAIFLAKFITKSTAVMKRIGPDGEGFEKLSTEVESAIAKTIALLKDVNSKFADEVVKQHVAQFFSMNQQSMEDLMNLCADLTLVKNWVLDKKPLP